MENKNINAFQENENNNEIDNFINQENKNFDLIIDEKINQIEDKAVFLKDKLYKEKDIIKLDLSMKYKYNLLGALVDGIIAISIVAIVLNSIF